jgi:predicted acyltransferase (DUF342 family)
MMQTKSKAFFNYLLGLFLLFFVNIAFAYTFPGNLPPGCSQSGSNFTCSSPVTFDRNVSFTGSGNVTVTINNTLTIRTYTIGSASDNANVTFVVNGIVYIDSSTIYADISASSNTIQVNSGQFPTIFGNLTTTSGSITARGVINGNISSTSGQINLNDQTILSGTLTNQTGTTNIYNNSRVSGAVSSTSGQIILYGNNTLSSTLSCTTCTVTIWNSGSRIDGAVTVGVLNDASSASSPGTIYNSAITTLTGDATVGYYATVTGNINAFNAATVRDNATVNGNVTSKNNIQIGYFATVTGNLNTTSNSTITVQVMNDAKVNGNIVASSTGSVANLNVYLWYRTTFNGSITANSADGLYVDVHDDSIYNGNITAFGASSARVRVGFRTVVTGDITVNSNTDDNGDIEIHATARVNGSLKAFGDISQQGTVTGCAQSTYTTGGSTHINVSLFSGSSTGGVCQGTSSCTTNLGFVQNSSGGAMPPICSLSATLIAQYHLDETAWNGTLNEIKDNAGFTGGPFDGQGIGSPMPTAANSSPAKPGSNGTCGYATFTGAQTGGSAITLDGLPVNTAAGAKTSVSFWMYWDGVSNNVAPIGWFRYNLYFSGSFFGFNTDSGDMNGINNASLANGWNHVVAVFTNGAVASNKLYINGNIQTFTKNDSATLSNAVVASTLQLSGQTRNQNWRFFNGRVDEVKVYNGEVSQAQVTADYNATHACTNAGKLEAYYQFDEYSWSGSGPEVIDSSGNNFHATLSRRSGTTNATIGYKTPALSGASGTCNYGVFTDQQLVSLPASFPNLTTNFTLSAWFNTANANQATQRIISDDAGSAGGAGTSGYALTLNDNGEMNKLKFFRRSPSIVAEINHAFQSNTWYYTAVTNNASTNTVKIYLYNAAGGLISSTTVSGSSSAFDNGLTTIGAEPIGSAEVRGFNGSLDEIRLYSRALSDAEIATLSQDRHACQPFNYNEAAADFNCVIPNGDAKTGRLYTQLAGRAFNFDVVARNANGDVETDFAGLSNQTVTVEFVDSTNYANATACVANSPATSAITTQNVTFVKADAGREKNISTTINGAYRNLRCRVKEGATIKGCSQDNFAVRPASFTVTSTNANAGNDFTQDPNRDETATPVFKAAVDPFNLTASTNVVGYNGTPIIRTPTGFNNEDVYSWAYGAAPLVNYFTKENNRSVGSVSGSFSAADPATGNAMGNAFTYSEAGYFRFQQNSIIDTSFTAVDQAGGDCTADYSNTLVNGRYGCNIGHNHDGLRTVFFGRFIPAYFTISPSTTTPACSNNFTYFGQDGLSSTFTITAKNGLGNTTINYTNNAATDGEIYGRLNLSAASSYNFTASSGTIASSIITSAGNWRRGQATVTAKHTITRTDTLTAPTNITIFARPTDSDGVTMPSPAAVSNDSPFRYGRLKVSNAYGSELLPLSIPVEAQYWDGTNYRRNTLDTCTNIGTTNVTLSNYTKNLSAGDTTLSGGGVMNAGKSTFTLTRPGAGNNGSVDLNFSLLNFPWLGTGNQSARATFGLYKSPIIYMRENY